MKTKNYQRSKGMKKVLFTSVAALCLIGMTIVQPSSASGDDFNAVWMEWLKFNNWDKDAAYQVMNQMQEKIRQEFPMDPQLAQTLDNIQKQYYAAMEAKAKEYGYSNFKDAYQSDNQELVSALKYIEADFMNQRSQLTSAYYEEFNRRYNAACVEIMKRLMENANAMSN
jgi:hypothetical protein